MELSKMREFCFKFKPIITLSDAEYRDEWGVDDETYKKYASDELWPIYVQNIPPGERVDYSTCDMQTIQTMLKQLEPYFKKYEALVAAVDFIHRGP